MAGMKFRRAPEFALVLWYLMRPPMPRVNADSLHRNAADPLANWVIVESFSTKKNVRLVSAIAAGTYVSQVMIRASTTDRSTGVPSKTNEHPPAQTQSPEGCHHME